MMELLSTTLAVVVIPACVLRAIFDLGLKEATNWSLRAANKRTTLLLVWDEDDKKEIPGIPKYRGNRGGKRRKRETEPRHSTPPPQPTISEEPAPAPHVKGHTVQLGEMRVLADKIAVLSDQITAFFYVDPDEAAQSPIAPEPVLSLTPPPPPFSCQEQV